MTLKDLEFILELNGVVENDIGDILIFCKKNGISKDLVDAELEKLGYEKLPDSDFDDDDDDDDEIYGHVEKFKNKRQKFSSDYD